MTAPASTTTIDLVSRFPEFVTADTRPGFSGFIVKKENLVEVATALRDEFNFDLLSSVTGVDYIADNKMEVVYHLHRTTGGPGIVFAPDDDRGLHRRPGRQGPSAGRLGQRYRRAEQGDPAARLRQP